jgi:hypothetical protein
LRRDAERRVVRAVVYDEIGPHFVNPEAGAERHEP